MAQNLAVKWSPKVAERFSLKSLTDSAVNQDYDWAGVDTVNVYSVDTAAMTGYTRSGTARYGTPGELGTSKQTLTLARDRAFTFVIDRGNWSESQMVTEAGKALAREIDEVVTPEIDTYRIAKMCAAAETNSSFASTVAATSASNAYTIVLELNELLSDNKVPLPKRILFVRPSFYKYLKLDNSFILNSDLGQQKLVSGQVGEIDGNRVVVVPSAYWPNDTDALLVHPSATVAPMKLEDYKTHDNPPGINGWLVEGRLIYDAFVLDAKVDALAVHSTNPSS